MSTTEHQETQSNIIPITSMGDYRTYDVVSGLQKCTISGNGLNVVWQDSKRSFFHAIWLRDNCACAECRDPVTLERTFDTTALALDIVAATAEITADGQLQITWPGDGHQSSYNTGWLRAHAYDDDSRQQRQQSKAAKVLWDADLKMNPPTYEFTSLVEDDTTLLSWLKVLQDYGFALVVGAPQSAGQVAKLAARVGFARSTNFGPVFDVISTQEPNSSAYTADELPLHTDLPARELQPGIQMLHCIKNDAEGGGSILADGFKLAALLRHEDPLSFDILAHELASFRFLDEDVDYNTRFPIIELDAQGETKEIRYNSWILSALDISSDQMMPYYRALQKFAVLTKRSDLQLHLRLEAGQIMTFDNRRVLHARRSFDPSTGDRVLQGLYVDTEELVSRIDVLQRR